MESFSSVGHGWSTVGTTIEVGAYAYNIAPTELGRKYVELVPLADADGKSY